MPLTPRRAAGWWPRGTPALRGWQSRACESRGEAGAGARGGGGGGVGRPALPGAPGSAGSLLRPRRGQALRRRGASRRRRSGAGERDSGPGPASGSRAAGQLRPRARGLHEALQGAGQGRRRGPAPPPGLHAGPTPRTRAPCLCPQVTRRGSREGGRRSPQVCRGAPAAAAGEALVRSRLPGRGALLLRVGPPRREHADTLAHTGWHRHNPPAGVTGALLPAAETCPRYGACAKAFHSPGGVSRGGVRCSAGLGGGSRG
ncbi:uncharacterized protein LOC141579779 [Camelus bactrianus]|uniref:Uncharacterized protein LOC141579779 n=1 Tax=Camelus bactrianus TaxID=9837 RepID=A0AC58RJ35_CAMBA